MTLSRQEMWGRINEAGIIAVLPGDLPLAQILEVGDGLLASPVLAVAVTLDDNPEAVTMLTDLRKRAGDHMLVGAAGVEDVAAVDACVGAGAQFALASALNTAVLVRCDANRLLYVPGVADMGDARRAAAAGCMMVWLTVHGTGDAAYLEVMRDEVHDLAVLVTGDVTAAHVADYATAGAAGVLVGTSLYTGSEQKMADLIQRARQLKTVWDN